jgi:hypothetical protein
VKVVFHAPIELFYLDLVNTWEPFTRVGGMTYDVIIIGRELVEKFLFFPRSPDQWAILKGALLTRGKPPAVLQDLLDERIVVAISHEEF